ncbi:hypothetical protein BDZ89DRAFT_1048136 [Hymenopellis radicata]|nr:hypothetical protein BDZ89DRAFT_1051071 [Hymenopellis radicata]KAF9008588.1 hypothetical protein BDZ89DRAFT_1048136 [Hymenopellis radicata]
MRRHHGVALVFMNHWFPLVLRRLLTVQTTPGTSPRLGNTPIRKSYHLQKRKILLYGQLFVLDADLDLVGFALTDGLRHLGSELLDRPDNTFNAVNSVASAAAHAIRGFDDDVCLTPHFDFHFGAPGRFFLLFVGVITRLLSPRTPPYRPSLAMRAAFGYRYPLKEIWISPNSGIWTHWDVLARNSSGIPELDATPSLDLEVGAITFCHDLYVKYMRLHPRR